MTHYSNPDEYDLVDRLYCTVLPAEDSFIAVSEPDHQDELMFLISDMGQLGTCWLTKQDALKLANIIINLYSE